MEFQPEFTLNCQWKLSYNSETAKHFGSCTIGRRGNVYEAAFATQISKRPRFAILSGNVKSFVDKRPKENILVVGLKSSNPNLLTVDVLRRSDGLLERLAKLVKELHASGRSIMSPKRSPQPSRPAYSFMSSPTKMNSRGSRMLLMSQGSSSEPRPSPAKRIMFYHTSSPQSVPVSAGQDSTTPVKSSRDQWKGRKLLVPPSPRTPIDFIDEDFDDFESPVAKRCKYDLHPQESNSKSLHIGRSLHAGGSLHIGGNTDSSLKGLSNIGNSCYMNAILQSLLSLDCFAEDMGQPWIQKYAKARSLYQMLYLLLKSIRSKEPLSSRSILLKELKATISTFAKQFAGQFENDAHEFLSKLLSLLGEEWGSLQVKMNSSESESAVTSRKICPVVNNFVMAVKTTISCKECGYSRASTETYQDLPIYLPKRREELPSMSPTKLHDMIRAFFEDEVIECTCDKCGHTESVLCKQLAKLPKILILHVKRYQYDPVRGKFFKLLDPITLPSLIDMDAYSCTGIQDPSTVPVLPASEDKENVPSAGDVSPKYRKCGEVMYRLMSVVSHIGDSSSGHYISDIYSLKAGGWQSCNDSAITKITEEEVRSKRQKTGYVLFYMHQSIFQSSLDKARLATSTSS